MQFLTLLIVFIGSIVIGLVIGHRIRHRIRNKKNNPDPLQ